MSLPDNSNQPPSSDRIQVRLAIYFHIKKRAQFLTPLFTQSRYQAISHPGQTVDVEVVVIEEDHEIESKGPFDILLMKITDVMTCALYSTDKAARFAAQSSLDSLQSSISRLQQDVKRPLTVIEPFERVHVLLNRARIQAIIQNMNERVDKDKQCVIPHAFLFQQKQPTTSASASSEEVGGMRISHELPSDLRFPVICKSIAACGTPASHRMYVVQSMDQFECMHADSHSKGDGSDDATALWLVQQFVNHSAILFKVYVLDQEVHVVAKPSIPDLPPNSPAYVMNSQDMVLHTLSPSTSSSTSSSPATSASSASPSSIPPPSLPKDYQVPQEVVAAAQSYANQLRSTLNLCLFGFDLLMSSPHASEGSSSSPLFYLVDINYFPSYKSLPNLAQRIIQICLRRRLEEASAK